MIVKQLELFEKVDIFRTVKDMRDYREGMLFNAVIEFSFFFWCNLEIRISRID